jgi:hypothetical protein
MLNFNWFMGRKQEGALLVLRVAGRGRVSDGAKYAVD